jgi:hypothetical protein
LASSIRYRAYSNVVYGKAFEVIIRYARAHPEPDFSFGPLDLRAVENGGLVLSGPDLAGISDVLDEVTGLVRVDA